MLTKALKQLLLLPSLIVMAFVRLLALAFAPMRLGRMLQTVSIPRMREHGLRTTFTVLGISLGVAVLVAVILVSRSIVSGVTSTVDDLAGKADLQVAAGSSGFDEAVLDKIREIPGIHKMTPVVQQITSLRRPDGTRERLLVLGVDLLGSEDSYFRSYDSKELTEIRREPLSFLNSSQNIILSRDLADRLGAKLHDKVSMITGHGAQEFEVWGFIEAKGVGRAFGGAVGIMYYPALQVAFERGLNIDRIDIAVKPGTDPEPVAQALQGILGEGFDIDRPTNRGDRVAQMLTAMRTALSMSSVLALVAGAFLVINTMGISVVQRKRELGIMRALGTTRRQLITLLTLEGALLGAVGSTFGVLLAVGISRLLLGVFGDAVSEVYMEQAASKIELDPYVMAFGFALGIIASTVAAYIATNKAGSIKPTEALSSASLMGIQGASTRASDVVGLLLLVVTVFLLRLPPVGNMPYGAVAGSLTLTLGGRALMPRIVASAHALMALFRSRFMSVETIIATDNLPRDLPRTASMASGLMAGVSLTVGIGTFVVSFITSLNTWSGQLLPGDLFVTSGIAVSGLSGRNTPMAPGMREQLLAIPGVEAARGFRFVDIQYDGVPIKLGAVEDPERSTNTFLEGTEAEAIAELKRGGLVVSENFSRRFNVHKGDQLPLSTKLGTRRFPVAAVVVDYTSDRGIIKIMRDVYEEHWGDTRIDSFEIFVRKGVEPESVRSAINTTLSDKYDLFVLTNAEFRGEFVKAADKIFSLMHVLELVTLVVAVLGMVTAVLANVLDRVREVGVLRALGMLRRQVRKMVVVEATLIGGVGALGGVLVGLGIGYILLRYIAGVQMGWHLPYEFPLKPILTMIAICLPASALAGFYPARQAARMPVSDALEYE